MANKGLLELSGSYGARVSGLFALLLLSMFPSSTPEVRRYVLIVGHNGADSEEQTPLKYADDDAARFYELLSKVTDETRLFVTFDSKSQRTFQHLVKKARPPTLDSLRRSAAQVLEKVERDAALGVASEIYFIYAGHGDVQKGEGYLVMQDGRLTRSEFERMLLDRSKARVTHVIVDACKSYFFASGRGPGGERVPYARAFAPTGRRSRVGYVLSTSDEAETHEWSTLSGGIFSHEVRSALLGAADADESGAVDYQELAAFVAVANESVPYPKFKPSVFVHPPSGDLSAVLLEQEGLKRAARLRFGASRSGRISISDHRGLRYLDVNKASGAPLNVLLLEPHRYEVRMEKLLYSITSTSGAVTLADIAPQPDLIASRSEIHRAFAHLFGAPYGAEVVRGFKLAREGPAQNLEYGSVPEGAPAARVALGSSGALGLITGVVLSVLSNQQQAEANGASQQRKLMHLERARDYQIGAGISLGVGAGLLISALLWEWLD